MLSEANIYIFNVEKGDSILIEVPDNNSSHWIVIDCHCIKKQGETVCPAFEYLKVRQVQSIAAVIITHFHDDHYFGMEKILDRFQVEQIIIPPIFSVSSSSFQKSIANIRDKIAELMERTPDEVIGRKAYSLAFIIKYLLDNKQKIIEVDGPESNFRIGAVDYPIGTIHLPLKRVKGNLRKMILEGDFSVDHFKDMNSASVVVSLNLEKHSFLFGADSTASEWFEHRRLMGRSNVKSLSASLLKISHHGSKKDNPDSLFDYWLLENGPKKVFISADGKRHPHDEIFQTISSRDLSPYCTCLANQCVADNLFSLPSLAVIPPELRGFLSSYETYGPAIPCQGDITISVKGEIIEVFNSTGYPCVYRPRKPPLKTKILT